MEHETIVAISIMLALFMLLSRAKMPSHGLSLYGTLEAFQHIAVGFIILAIFVVEESRAKLIVIGCLVVPTILELLLFFFGPKRQS
jgi:hypothetical protein